MNVRVVRTLVASTAILAVFASPANAASTTVTDARGDGNFVSDCYTGSPLPEACVPPVEQTSQPGLDITSIKWTTKKANRRPVALIVTMTLAGRPNINENHYQAYFSLGGDTCQANPAIESWSTDAYLRICPNSLDEKVVPISRPKVTSNKVIFTVPTGSIAQVGVRAGTSMRDLGGYSGPMLSSPELPVLGSVGGTPYFDGAYSTKSYVFGR